MPKLVLNLTDTQIRSALSSHKKLSVKVQIKLADGKGLFFIIDKNGNAYWTWDYTRPITKKRNSISLGTYPEISLSNARAKRADCRELLAQNIDPAIQKQREVNSHRFCRHLLVRLDCHHSPRQISSILFA